MTTNSLMLMICAGWIPMAAWAANDAAVAGPVTGFVFDAQAGHIRPMLGMPGSAYLGTTVISNVDSASVSPDGSAAFAIQAGKLVLYTGLASASPLAVDLRGSITADHFAWGPGATAAAIYSSKSAQAQIVSNLLETPSAGAPIDLSGLSGQVAALAFDGQQIILAVGSGGSGSIYTVTAQSGPQRIASAASPSAIVLAGADLYFADQQTGQIWQVQSYARQPVPVLFAADASISSPVGLQLSVDNSRLYVANAGSRALSIYDVAARSQIESIALNFAPTRVDRFGNASVFLLNNAGQGQTPLYVFSDANAAKLAIYFVPSPGDANSHHPILYRPN
jgi:DNA-binding beta-propeller fold protein YncE